MGKALWSSGGEGTVKGAVELVSVLTAALEPTGSCAFAHTLEQNSGGYFCEQHLETRRQQPPRAEQTLEEEFIAAKWVISGGEKKGNKEKQGQKQGSAAQKITPGLRLGGAN